MSKGNMLLGHARGKVGDLVFSRTNGKQVTRARAAVVKNPKTDAQKIQRTLMNTIAQAYSKMLAITDHSFEGVKSGQDSMAYFMRVNLNKLREYLSSEIAAGYDLGSIYAFSPMGTNVFSVNSYVIAKGQLPSLGVGFIGATAATIGGISANTYGDVINSLGLQRGDQLTFVAIDGDTQGNTAFNFARVILSPTGADGAELSLDTPFIDSNAISSPNNRNEGSFNTLTFDNGTISFNFNGRAVMAAAVIVSRLGSTGWQRSNTELAQNVTAVAGTQYSMQEALDYVDNSELGTRSDLYLNNAGRTDAVNIVSGTNFAAVTYDGTAVTLVGTGYGSVTVVDSQDPSDTQVVTAFGAYDSNGNFHVIADGNTTSRAYGKFMINPRGYTDGRGGEYAAAWSSWNVTNELLAADKNASVGLFNQTTSQGTSSEPGQPFYGWMVQNGVSPTVYVVVP